MVDSTERFVIFKAFRQARGREKRELVLEMLVTELKTLAGQIESKGIQATELGIGSVSQALRTLAGLCDEAQDPPRVEDFTDLPGTQPWSTDPDVPTIED